MLSILSKFTRAMLLSLTTAVLASSAPAEELPLYIGVTTKTPGAGIQRARFDTATGVLQGATSAVSTSGSQFLASSPNGRYVYAISDDIDPEEKKAPGLSAFEVQADGSLKLINAVPASGGVCHLSTDATGKWLLAAAYSNGEVGVWPLDGNGAIGERTTHVKHEGKSVNEKRQTAPHPHQILTSPDNRRVFVADLGTDKIAVYDFDAATGALAPNTPSAAKLAPGAGPRHLAFHPSNGFMYVVNELDNTVTAFENTDGAFKAVQAISTIPDDYDGTTYTAEITVSPNGRFVYATNRGHHSIAGFEVQSDGRLKLASITSTPAWPQHFSFDPSGKWLLSANRDDKSVTVYRADENTGALAETSRLDGLADGPMCVIFAARP